MEQIIFQGPIIWKLSDKQIHNMWPIIEYYFSIKAKYQMHGMTWLKFKWLKFKLNPY